MRDSTPGTMIQQQMYARERRGIFRSTEGYDTIAKSNGLEPSFIKKVLHPFCVYDAPTVLATRGEKDEAAYPETMHLLHLENGDILLGRSVYQAADFTGLRSAFFTHNYIIPSAHVSKLSADYESWLQASFLESYNIDEGTEISELSKLPIEAAAAIVPSYRSILALLNIDEQAFKQLLYTVMAAIGGKKKIYVSLDVPIKQLPEKAKQLLKVLYASLPYAFRKELGFITYAKEPQSRKGVHLTFVEQGSLRATDRSIEKDYIFDFANDRIMNADLDGMDQPYLDFAWNNLERPDRAASFFHFAELMLAGMEPERQTAVSSYHELCIMYQIEEGNEKLYEAHKSSVLRGLLTYLKPADSVDSKIRLNDLFLARFDYEYDLVVQGVLPETFIVDAFKEYYRIDRSYIEKKLVGFFIVALNQAKKLNKRNTIDAIYAAVESDSDLSQAFFGRLMADARIADQLFIPYLDQKFKAAAGTKTVFELMEQWGNAFPKIFGNESYMTLIKQQLMEKLKRERHSLSATNRVLEQLHNLAADNRAVTRKQSFSHETAELYQEMELSAYRAMLTELDMARLTKEQLMSASFLKYKEQFKSLNEQLNDPRQKSAALELMAVYDCVALPEPTVSLFRGLSSAEIDRVQQVGRRLLSAETELATFPRLVLLFLRSSDMETVDYAGLLTYLQQYAPNKELVYVFFRWAEKQPEFMRPRGFVPAYTAAIVEYFKKYDRDAFKKRANRKQYFDQAGPALSAVYKQAERELSSPLTKFFRSNRKSTLITSLSAIGIALIVVGISLSSGGKDELKPVTTVSPTPDPNIAEPKWTVFAEQHAAVEGVEASTSLVFSFQDEATCAQFMPNSLTVQSPGAEAVEYAKLAVSTACKAGKEAESSTQPSGSDIAEVTDEPTATPTIEPTATDAQPEHTSDAGTIPPLDQYLVTVNLGTQVDIPEKSIIKVGPEQHEITVLTMVEQ